MVSIYTILRGPNQLKDDDIFLRQTGAECWKLITEIGGEAKAILQAGKSCGVVSSLPRTITETTTAALRKCPPTA